MSKKDDFPEPMLVLDFTGEPPRSLEGKAREAKEFVERRAVERVRVVVEMVFGYGAGAETLAAGTLVDRVEPTDHEQKELERLLRLRRQHCMIRWFGRVRYVPACDVERVL